MEENKNTEIEIGDLYTINKQLVKQLPYMTVENIKAKVNDCLFNIQPKQYYMLLCRDRNDYTVFVVEQYIDRLSKELSDLIIDRGHVVSVENTKEKDAIEIWIKIDGEAFCYYFFDYTNGVIEV